MQGSTRRTRVVWEAFCDFLFVVKFGSANVGIFSRGALPPERAHFVAFAHFESPQQAKQNIYANKTMLNILC